MRSIRVRKMLGVLLAVCWALGSSTNAQGLVLCFGDDGHVEVEFEHRGQHPVSPSGHHAGEHGNDADILIVPGDDCGACSDVPYFLACIEPGMPPNNGAAFSEVAVVAICAEATASRAPHGVRAVGLPRHFQDRSLLPLRSIVLII